MLTHLRYVIKHIELFLFKHMSLYFHNFHMLLVKHILLNLHIFTCYQSNIYCYTTKYYLTYLILFNQGIYLFRLFI